MWSRQARAAIKPLPADYGSIVLATFLPTPIGVRIHLRSGNLTSPHCDIIPIDRASLDTPVGRGGRVPVARIHLESDADSPRHSRRYHGTLTTATRSSPLK